MAYLLVKVIDICMVEVLNMKKIAGKRLITLLLCALPLFAAGCSETKDPITETETATQVVTETETTTQVQTETQTEEDAGMENPITGGQTIKVDENAPKVIESKDIVKFATRFYLTDRWSADESNIFEFEIAEDESGKLVASEYISGLKEEADEELLTALQQVIDDENLVKYNGKYDVTAGLPPEFEAIYFVVDYASGEYLDFTMDNDPMSSWEEKIYRVFADWFESKGHSELYPMPETADIVSFKLTCIDGEEEFCSDDYKDISDETYKEIADIILKYNLVRNYDFSRFDYTKRDYGNHDRGYYGMGEHPEDEHPDQNIQLSMRIEYADDIKIRIETKMPSEFEAMKPMVEEIIACFPDK